MYNQHSFVREFMNMAAFVDSTFELIHINSNSVALVPSLTTTGVWASNIGHHNSNSAGFTYFCNTNIDMTHMTVDRVQSNVNELITFEILFASNSKWLLDTCLYLSNVVGNESYESFLDMLSNTAYSSSNDAASLSNIVRR